MKQITVVEEVDKLKFQTNVNDLLHIGYYIVNCGVVREDISYYWAILECDTT